MERVVSQLERLMPRAAALSLGVCMLYAASSLSLSMLNKALLSRCVREPARAAGLRASRRARERDLTRLPHARAPLQLRL